jgi:Flp pilus assembly protein TadG
VARSSDQGFALVYVAILLVSILLFAGLCLDAGRAYVVKAQMIKAVDGAALGAARMLNSGDPRAEAAAIFKANFPSGFMGTTTADPTAAGDFYSLETDEANGVNTVQIRASAVMPTTLMSLADQLNVTVGAFGEAQRRMVDLCLVLDVSSSLGWRYPSVRDAARAFVGAFDENSDRLCLVTYSNGANVLFPMPASRGFDKTGLINAIPQNLPGGSTAMVEGLYRGWDELRTVPSGQQSSLRVIVLFTDGASNSVPGFYDVSPATAKGLRTYDFPKNLPDPDGQTWDNPQIVGLFDTQTGAQSPSHSTTVSWNSTTTLAAIPLLPLVSAHTHFRSSGIPTSFALQDASLQVNGVSQTVARGLRNQTGGRYPAEVWNINNAARNLLEIIANQARNDNGDYRIRIFTIGMGELVQYFLGTIPEQPEQILMRLANDIDSQDYDETQLEGKYYFAATTADIGPAFQELQNQIIRLTK